MIEALADRRIVSLACGSANSLVLDDGGRVFFFGLDYSEFPKFTEGQARFVLLPSALALGLDEEIAEVRAGEGHCLLLTREGKLLAFGLGKNGRLGLGDETNRLTPTAVTFPSNGTVRGMIESLTRVVEALERAGIVLIGENAASGGGGLGVRFKAPP